MSRQQLIRLVVALAVVLAAWGGMALLRRAGSDRAMGLALPRVDTSAVDTMEFIKRADTVIVARAPAGWRVNGFPVDTTLVHTALAALADSTNRTELVAETRASDAAMGVTADSGRHVRIVVAKGPGIDLIAGHQTSDFNGVFVRRPSDSAVYAMRGMLANQFDHTLADWRDKRIASVVGDSVRRLEVQRGREAYTLLRDGK